MRFHAFYIGLLAFLMSISTALAADTKLYAFDKVPDIGGVMQRNGEFLILLGISSATSDARNTHRQLVKISPNGGAKCKKLEIAEIGVVWTTTSCVTMRKIDTSSYALTIDSKFVIDGYDPSDSESLQILKEYDFVRQRKIAIEFKPSSNGCTAVVTARSYLPLDGKKFVGSRTGKIGCDLRRG